MLKRTAVCLGAMGSCLRWSCRLSCCRCIDCRRCATSCIGIGTSTAYGCLASEACLPRGCLRLRPGGLIPLCDSRLPVCTRFRILCFLLLVVNNQRDLPAAAAAWRGCVRQLLSTVLRLLL